MLRFFLVAGTGLPDIRFTASGQAPRPVDFYMIRY